jgi:hypothetical protein
VSKYGHLVLYGVVLLAVYGFCRPGSQAGQAVTSVTDSLSGVLGAGLEAV